MKSPQKPEVAEPAGLDRALRLEVAAALRALAEYAGRRRGGTLLMPVCFRFVPAGPGREILVPVMAADPAGKGTDDGR